MKTKNHGIATRVAICQFAVPRLDALDYLNLIGDLNRLRISSIRPRICMFMIILCFPFISTIGQTYFFEPCSPPSIGNLADASYIDTLETIPQLGSIEFVQFHSTFIADTFGVINITLPRANNADLEFYVTDAYYENSSDFFIQARNAEGFLTIYVKGSLQGATIDLVDTVYTIYPFTGNKGILIQNDLSEEESSICAQEASLESAEFCEEEDCGEDILDVLLLITPAANTWLANRYNTYATWFLLVETHNILGAFRRSDIPNKRIRYAYVNYTPDFSPSSIPNDSRA